MPVRSSRIKLKFDLFSTFPPQAFMDLIYRFQNNIDTTPSGHAKLVNFYLAYNQSSKLEVVLDLNEVNFIDANQCALLGAILTKLGRENRHKFSFIGSQILGQFNILSRNGFIKSSSESLTLGRNSSSAVRMALFTTEQDTEFLDYIENELLCHPALVKHIDFKDELIEHFSELFANIATHAQTNEVFVCGQYYPKRRELKFSIVDLGIGFLPPIMEYTKGEVATAEQAIAWALNGNSTKLDAPGGLGIKSLYEYCINKSGYFNIISGDSYWGNNLGTIGNRTIKPLCGTIVHLIFKC